MGSSNVSGHQQSPAINTAGQYIPELEIATLANDEETSAYISRLKKYFISGKKTDEGLVEDVYPLSLALKQRKGVLNTHYPVFYDGEYDSLISLYRHLEVLVELHFNDEVSEIIYQELPILWNKVQKAIQDKGIECIEEEIITALQTLELPQKDSEAFELSIDNIQKALQGYSTNIFDYNHATAFQLLNLQMQLQSNLKSTFLLKLKKAIIGLKELLSLHNDVSGESAVQMDFASDLISFDKIKAVAIPKISSQLSEPNLARLKSALQALTAAQQWYTQVTTTVFTSSGLAEAFDMGRIFSDVNISIVPAGPCHYASVQSQKDTATFVKIVAALRMANLMMEQQYDENLHDLYFDQFDLSYLTAEDLQYLPPIIVIDYAHQLTHQYNDFISLLTQNSFVKVLGINLLEDLFSLEKLEDYLELASLAISQRNSYVFQGGIDLPSGLSESYKTGLAFPGATFWNVLIPFGENASDIALTAAIESRYFPRIEYRALGDNQIKLRNNHAPLAYQGTLEQQVKSSSGIEPVTIGLTIADFLAIAPQLKDKLEVIPPIYQSTTFIPLYEYLSQSEQVLSGKIPFIWMVNDQNKLGRVAIPVYWVQKCRSRLEYWAFLQSISGTSKNHIQEIKTAWEIEKTEEIETLKATFQEKYEKAKAGDLEEAVVRMLYGLLNQKDGLESVLTVMSKGDFQPVPPPQQEKEPSVEEQAEVEEAATAVSEEAWVETEECTSCKDCVDALPAVFKYDNNKQAFVHNPKGGTFADIVKAAEKCPARCIHPGIPQNKNEASLEKWIQRAEKYN